MVARKAETMHEQIGISAMGKKQEVLAVLRPMESNQNLAQLLFAGDI